MLETPDFKIVPRTEAEKRRLPRRPRRHWGPIVDALGAGRTLFIPDTELSESNVKYLQLAFARRGRNEHLRTERTVRDSVVGRDLWVIIEIGSTMVDIDLVDA